MSDQLAILKQYECGLVPLPADPTAGFKRHLVFDHVLDPGQVTLRQRFWAVARSVRDVLAQRWLKTKEVYYRENPKRVYYLSMEFLIGRSLANNVANLMIDPIVREIAQREGLDLEELARTEMDAGLGNGGLGRLAACFIDSLATMGIPAHGYGLRYEYGMFRQEIKNGYQVEAPDNWLRRPDPWEVIRYTDTIKVPINASLEFQDGRPRLMPNRPTLLLGIPYDRPVIGWGGKTINTLRLWEAASPDFFDLGEFNQGDFFGAVHNKVMAENLTRVLYPDDTTAAGRTLRLRAGVLPGRLLPRGHPEPLPPQQCRLARPTGQSGDPVERHAPVTRCRRADAHPARRSASRVGRRLGSDSANAGLHQPHAAARSAGEVAGAAL